MKRDIDEAVRSTTEIGLEWVAKLRWGAGAALWGGVAYAGAKAQHPLAPLIVLATVMPATNVLLLWALRRKATWIRWALDGVILLDLGLLTGTLAFSGGPSNPFSVFYLVYVTLAASLRGTRQTWLTVAIAVGCYASLFAVPSEHAEHMRAMEGGAFSAHLWGMFVAFAIAAGLVAHFVSRLAQALRIREQDLARARERVARSERLASVMALAAGTAHEMGSPLATIALAAKELERAASSHASGEAILSDARLIRSEVERCRTLLEQLGARAGDLSGEPLVAVSFAEVLSQLRSSLPGSWGQALRARVAPEVREVVVPQRALVQVLASLVRNGFDATAPGSAPVELEAARVGPMLRVAVRDQGRGMNADDLARACEPFFTTKPAGAGLGLGLFLVERFAQQLGGSLALSSRPGEGTTATLEFTA